VQQKHTQNFLVMSQTKNYSSNMSAMWHGLQYSWDTVSCSHRTNATGTMMDELPPLKCRVPARAARHQQCVHVNTVQSADYATDAQLGVLFGSPQTSHTPVLNCSADNRAMSTT